MTAPTRRRWLARLAWGVGVWAVLAYLIAPVAWKLWFAHEGDFSLAQHLTETSDHHPGDPVNLALVGTSAALVRAMSGAGWYPADPITLRTSLEIAADSVLHRPDAEAPVSNLFLFGRKQDLAFEQPVPGGPKQRHHVRFWRWDQQRDGLPVWFGSATYDERVGLSYTTGEVTHHIAPDVDRERDRIAAELSDDGCVKRREWIDGFHNPREGRNGGGDPWRTDGRLAVLYLQPCAPSAPPGRAG